MKIYIGSDHNGFELKKQLITFLVKGNYEVIDCGDSVLDPRDDYPKFAATLAHQLEVSSDPESFGILICGSGQGINIAANRFSFIRSALCWNVVEAHSARNDDDCNVLSLSARSTSFEEAVKIINSFLSTPFAGAGRFKRRLIELSKLP